MKHRNVIPTKFKKWAKANFSHFCPRVENILITKKDMGFLACDCYPEQQTRNAKLRLKIKKAVSLRIWRKTIVGVNRKNGFWMTGRDLEDGNVHYDDLIQQGWTEFYPLETDFSFILFSGLKKDFH